MNASVEHGAQRFDHGGTDAAQTFGEGIGAQQDHSAGFGFAEQRADSSSMRADEIHLELADLLGRDADRGKLAESGSNPVGRFAGGDDAIDDGTRSLHTGDSIST